MYGRQIQWMDAPFFNFISNFFVSKKITGSRSECSLAKDLMCTQRKIPTDVFHSGQNQLLFFKRPHMNNDTQTTEKSH